MLREATLRPIANAILLLTLPLVVHAAESTTVAAQGAKSRQPAATAGSANQAPGANQPRVQTGTQGLPAPVAEMREAILAAVRSGDIEELRVAIELSEIKPVFDDGPAADPIAWLKSRSVTGDGRDLLATIGRILDAGHVALPLGRDLENNRIYVWPYLAELDLRTLDPAQAADLAAILPEAEARKARETGKYGYWRLGIGADGTWHMLVR